MSARGADRERRRAASTAASGPTLPWAVALVIFARSACAKIEAARGERQLNIQHRSLASLPATMPLASKPNLCRKGVTILAAGLRLARKREVAIHERTAMMA